MDSQQRFRFFFVTSIIEWRNKGLTNRGIWGYCCHVLIPSCCALYYLPVVFWVPYPYFPALIKLRWNNSTLPCGSKREWLNRTYLCHGQSPCCMANHGFSHRKQISALHGTAALSLDVTTECCTASSSSSITACQWVALTLSWHVIYVSWGPLMLRMEWWWQHDLWWGSSPKHPDFQRNGLENQSLVKKKRIVDCWGRAESNVCDSSLQGPAIAATVAANEACWCALTLASDSWLIMTTDFICFCFSPGVLNGGWGFIVLTTNIEI